MKIRITAPGIFGAKGEIPVGTEVQIKGDPPAGWSGKFAEIGSNPKPDAKAVTNPAGGKKPDAKA